MRRNDILNRVNRLILYVSRTIPFRSGLDGYLIRGAMVFTFFAFSIQKWSQYTAEVLGPLISHSLVRIPTHSGQAYRFDAGHRSEMKPATIPI